MTGLFFRRALLFPLAGFLLVTGILAAWEVRDAVVAKVNGEIITNADISDLVYYNAKAQRLMTAQKPTLTIPEQEALAKEAVHSLVRTILVKQTADQLKKTVTEEEVQTYMKAQEIEDSDLTRRIAEGILLFDQILVAEGIIVRSPSPMAIRAFYQENIAQFIIVRQVIARQIVVPKATEATKLVEQNQAERYRREILREGSSFREIARKRCAFEDARVQEGLIAIQGTEKDQYFFAPSYAALKQFFPDVVLKALDTLPVETVSEVIESEVGFHILYIDRERPAKKITFEEATKDIERHLYIRNRIREQRRWLQRIMARSHITWHDDSNVDIEEVMPGMPKFELRQASGF